MNLIEYMMRLFREFREANEPNVVPLPDPDYASVFEFIRLSSKGYIADIEAISPGDPLVRKDRFGRDDVSYAVTDFVKTLGLDIPQAEWRDVETFDDMARLFLKHLERARHQMG